MSKNFDSPIEIGFCVSIPNANHIVDADEKVADAGEDAKLPELPQTAWVVTDGAVQEVPFDEMEDYLMVDADHYLHIRTKLLAALKENALINEVNAALRFRLHRLEEHNQHFVRCESAWCHPTNDAFGNPALDAFKGAKERAEQAEAALATMTEDRDLWQQAHDEDCPNAATVEQLRNTLAERDAKIAEISWYLSDTVNLRNDLQVAIAQLDEEIARRISTLREVFIVMSGKEGCNAPFDVERWSKCVLRVEAELARLKGE